MRFFHSEKVLSVWQLLAREGLVAEWWWAAGNQKYIYTRKNVLEGRNGSASSSANPKTVDYSGRKCTSLVLAILGAGNVLPMCWPVLEGKEYSRSRSRKDWLGLYQCTSVASYIEVQFWAANILVGHVTSHPPLMETCWTALGWCCGCWSCRRKLSAVILWDDDGHRALIAMMWKTCRLCLVASKHRRNFGIDQSAGSLALTNQTNYFEHIFTRTVISLCLAGKITLGTKCWTAVCQRRLGSWVIAGSGKYIWPIWPYVSDQEPLPPQTSG